jgi:hypothetical protein
MNLMEADLYLLGDKTHICNTRYVLSHRQLVIGQIMGVPQRRDRPD